MYVYTHIRIYTHIYIHVCMYTYIYIHTSCTEAELLSAITTFFKGVGITSADVGIKVNSRAVLCEVLKLKKNVNSPGTLWSAGPDGSAQGYIYVYIYVYVCICICIYICICMYIIYMCVCVCVCVCVYVYVYICIYVYISLYTHTYIYRCCRRWGCLRTSLRPHASSSTSSKRSA